MGDILKQFLVSLGFGVDEKQLKTFMKAVDQTVSKVKVMSAAIVGLAGGAFFGIAKISEGFEEMGYATRMIAPAINKAILLRQAMISAYKDAGINIVQAVQNSVRFNFALAKVKFQLEGIFKSTAMKFIPTLTKQMDIFRVKVSANMPKILAMLERFVKFIFKAFEGLVALGTRLWSMLNRVWDLIERIDDATSGWAVKILAVVAAWKLFNLSFLATPIGLILTGFIALLALYDDFMTFREGGESLFDWGSETVKTVVAIVSAVIGLVVAIKTAVVAMAAFKVIMTAVAAAIALVKGVVAAVGIAAMLSPVGLIVAAVGGLIALLTVLYMKWDTIKESVSGFFSGVGGKVLDFFGGDAKQFDVSPIGSTTSNSSAQNVKQETNIIVNGSTDPEKTAQVIGNNQNKVNFDMVRNMKGATR